MLARRGGVATLLGLGGQRQVRDVQVDANHALRGAGILHLGLGIGLGLRSLGERLVEAGDRGGRIIRGELPGPQIEVDAPLLQPGVDPGHCAVAGQRSVVVAGGCRTVAGQGDEEDRAEPQGDDGGQHCRHSTDLEEPAASAQTGLTPSGILGGGGVRGCVRARFVQVIEGVAFGAGTLRGEPRSGSVSCRHHLPLPVRRRRRRSARIRSMISHSSRPKAMIPRGQVR